VVAVSGGPLLWERAQYELIATVDERGLFLVHDTIGDVVEPIYSTTRKHRWREDGDSREVALLLASPTRLERVEVHTAAGVTHYDVEGGVIAQSVWEESAVPVGFLSEDEMEWIDRPPWPRQPRYSPEDVSEFLERARVAVEAHTPAVKWWRKQP
ncbi:MAG: hypothetical protein AAF581_06360, partial [Planctomycetota bacterium]